MTTASYIRGRPGKVTRSCESTSCCPRDGFYGLKYSWYTACDGGAVYTDAEKTCHWGKRQGTCGWAWSEATTTVFDSKRSDLKAPAGRLKRRQLQVQAIARLNSVLSTPVWDVKKVVGVLNFDSTSNEDETHLLDDDVTRLALAYAQILGPHCFRDGVKRS